MEDRASSTRTTDVGFAAAGVTIAGTTWSPAGTAKGTVVFLHGGGQSRASWRRIGQQVAESGWHAVAFDARGHGDSEWSPTASYAPADLIADLGAVLDVLPENPVLVGASMGGLTALMHEGSVPGTARGLVLVDVAPRLEPAGADEVVAFMRDGLQGYASVAEASLALSAYNPRRDRPPTLDGLRRQMRERGGRWYWHWDPRILEGTHGPGSSEFGTDEFGDAAREACSRIRIPTLLVRGAQSNVLSAAGAEELTTLIPHAQHVDVSGAGHMVSGDDNDAFGRHVVEFLGTLTRD
jgi:pimeloyl-ACP methyl ester carboxylesterase